MQLSYDQLHICSQTDITIIENIINDLKPQLIIIDSIHNMYHPDIDSAPGNIAQLKNATVFLNRVAKLANSALILVGHITKDDSLAGPMTLRHIVDAVLLLSTMEDSRFRILRPDKNRHASIEEIGIFEMTELGMKVIDNPSQIFLSKASQNFSGSVVTSLWQGSRPIFLEVQALADASVFSNPRRVSIGYDLNRVSMLLAILHKKAGMEVQMQDIYVNIVGGMQVEETSADLAVQLAIASSFTNKIVGSDTIVFGEVGLSGEVRPIVRAMECVREAQKLGFKKALIPLENFNKVELSSFENIEVFPVATLEQALNWLGDL